MFQPLTVLRGMQGERKIAVLGDMLELGSFGSVPCRCRYYAASNEVDLLRLRRGGLGIAQAAKRRRSDVRSTEA